MTDPNLLLMNQAIHDENWAEATRYQQLVQGLGQPAIAARFETRGTPEAKAPASDILPDLL